MSNLTLLALCLLLPACFAGWQNDWDKEHKAECSNGEYVTQMKSYHSNSKEDRRWEVTCGREAGLKADKDCAWTDYVNSWDQILTFTCPKNKVVTGMNSKHDNGKEDRLFKFRCCGVSVEKQDCKDGTFGADCQFACQCAGGQVCDKVTGSCPSACKDGKYGPGCQLDNSCYYSTNKAHYQGTKSTTVSGETCQNWAADKPHQHQYKQKCEFADGVLPENYCRTTLSEADTSPWCYTTSPSKRWESCGIDACNCPAGRYGEDCARECHCAESKSCDRETGECRKGDNCAKGWGGEGCQARTMPAPNGCYLTDYVNDWDKVMDWKVPAGSVITGFFSYHDNYREDRRWKFYVCEI